MSKLGSALLWAARLRGAQLDHRCRDPRPSQEAALHHLLQRARRTAFGKRHRFDRIRTLADFRAAMPLHRYEHLKPWFERAMNGEPDVTWPGAIPYFAMSSGTTAGNKYLPLSRDSIRQQQRGGFDPIASYLRWTDDTDLMDEKALLLASSTRLERKPSGVQVGDNTGIMALHMPRVVRRNQLPSEGVRAISDWDEKIAAVAAEAVHQDVRLLAGTPSWFPGFFDRLIAEARAQGRDARSVHDVWPELRLLTGGGVSFEPYRRLIRSRLGRHVPYVDVYNATEGGIMGVQDKPHEPAMRLLPDNGLFYELVPVEELTSAQPRRLSLWEAEVDVTYALAISTMSGIWSYLIGDCIRFVELFPHRFLFEGRTAAFLNVTGEHVSQGEIERAVRQASHELTLRVRDFTVSADVGIGEHGGSRHVFLIELDGATPDLDTYARLIDRHMGQTNDDYLTHRRSRSGLLDPVVILLPPGTFDAWMRAQHKLGGQHKVPRTLLDPERRAALLEFARARVEPASHLNGNSTHAHHTHRAGF